ncbi:hypothetical protein LINPERPRIM_LOCUS13981 [Linum perenne]
MEKLNNLFFTLMARGPDGIFYLLIFLSFICTIAADVSEVAGKEQMETQPAKKGRGRKQ